MSEFATTFAALGLPASMLAVLESLGYQNPTPIQAAAIPTLLAGEDLIGRAHTGSGKTAAFALPLLARLEPNVDEPQILVLTPTRELAIQVAQACQRYAGAIAGFRAVPIYGGQSVGEQQHRLRGAAQMIVGTPGRVIDHLRRDSLSLAKLRALVLDEADEMLRMGFLEDVEWILERTPKALQTALFSATLPDGIRAIARRHVRAPREIGIDAQAAGGAVRQRYWRTGDLNKLDALTRVLETEEIDAVLVFVRTKAATVELAGQLAARGLACAALHGDMDQAQREMTVERLRNAELDVVVATDVAARGLDVPRISHVVNYDAPYDIESYVHRIGRTGRAGRAGEAILFVAAREMRLLRAIERATGQPIAALRVPSLGAIAAHREMQFRRTVLDHLAREDLDFFERIVRELAVTQGVDPARIGAALAWMAQRERPLRVVSDASALANDAARGTAPEERGGRGARASGRGVRDSGSRVSANPPRRADSKRAFRVTWYRIDVGRAQGVAPKHIVGAVANEAGLHRRAIGRVELFDDFALLELPADMPRELLRRLQNVRFGQFRFNLRAAGAADGWALRSAVGAELAEEGRGSEDPAARPHAGPGGTTRIRGAARRGAGRQVGPRGARHSPL